MTISKPVRWVLFGVACYLFFAIVTAPATIVSNRFLPDEVIAQGVEGSAWRGSARSVIVQGVESTNLTWKLKPLSLLMLKTGAEITTRTPGGPVKATLYKSLFGDSYQIKNIGAALDIDKLGFLTGKKMVLDGKLGLELNRLHLADGGLNSLDGTITLAELIEPASKTGLGTFELVFDDQSGTEIKGIITDTDAVFKLNGDITISARNYTLDAAIQPTGTTPGEVLTALQFLGATRDGQGNYKLTMTGKF